MTSDLLGAPYEQRRIILPPDEEGDVVATLVSRRAPNPTRRAVLYIHGFVDYFFHTHVADFFTERGYDFYAIDLRKYGRSLLEHQTPNYCRDISDYFPELDEAVRIIRDEDGHDTLVIDAHSTGGLIGSLWAHRVRRRGLLQGLILNSPFFEFNEPWVVRRGLARIVNAVGARAPKWKLPQELGETHGRSLHRDFNGEWEYDLAWKPVGGYPIYAGWARAMSRAHRQLQSGLAIEAPVLVAVSARSYKGKFTEAAHHADSVLNVADAVRYAPRLGRNVTVLKVEGGKHDLALSPPPARQQFFTEVDNWLSTVLSVSA